MRHIFTLSEWLLRRKNSLCRFLGKKLHGIVRQYVKQIDQEVPDEIREEIEKRRELVFQNIQEKRNEIQ